MFWRDEINQLHGSIGQYVRDLELIAKATESRDLCGNKLRYSSQRAGGPFHRVV